MSFDLVVRGTLVLPHATVPDGWIGVSGGRIAAIDAGRHLSCPASSTARRTRRALLG
jgi:hypothetical protein